MTLRPTTKRLKQLIREHGASRWQLVCKQHVACFNHEIGLFITNGKHSRWVRQSDVQEE